MAETNRRGFFGVLAAAVGTSAVPVAAVAADADRPLVGLRVICPRCGSMLPWPYRPRWTVQTMCDPVETSCSTQCGWVGRVRFYERQHG